MVIYSDEMATSVSASLTYVAMTGSPYSPLKNGKLIHLTLGAAGDAVTSLIEKVVVQLTCPLWGVPLTIQLNGGGLRTAPVIPIPNAELDCDVPVATGNLIVIQIKNETAATPITPRYSLIGVFSG